PSGIGAQFEGSQQAGRNRVLAGRFPGHRLELGGALVAGGPPQLHFLVGATGHGRLGPLRGVAQVEQSLQREPESPAQRAPPCSSAAARLARDTTRSRVVARSACWSGRCCRKASNSGRRAIAVSTSG